MTAVGTEKEYNRDGKKTRMIVIQIEAENVKLEVALFGQYVDQVQNFIANNDGQQPIVVLQFAKIKTFKGKLVLQNIMHGTRILFNPEIPEVVAFKNSLPHVNDESSQSVSLLHEPQTYSLEEDFLFSTPRCVIKDLKEPKEDGTFVVFGTIAAIANDNDWWYVACKCNKAVKPDSDMYYCERCFCHIVNVIPRYKLKLIVEDDTDSATFIVFDRDGCSILKKSCSYLIETAQNRGDVGHPLEFQEMLIGRSFLFKIEVKAAISSHLESTFKVYKICSDAVIISKFGDPITVANLCAEKKRRSVIENNSTHKTESNNCTAEDDFLKVTPPKSIEQLKDCTKDGFYVVLASLKGVNSGSDWWFASCICGSAVTPDSSLYYCSNCDRHVVNIVPRYRIKLRVFDESDSTTFVLRDCQAYEILNMSCTDMLKSIEKSGGPFSHPKEFDEFLNGKQMLFKVELINVAINSFEYFNVIDICNDVSIISKFKDLNPVFISVQADVSVGLSPGKNSLSIGFNDVGSSSASKVDESEIIPPGFTPAKRSSEENIEEGDMSSTKMKMKAVKVEKD